MSRRVLLGGLPEGGNGLRIAKAGFSASDNPPVPANLIFDSAWPQLLPIHQIGVFAIGQNASKMVTFATLSTIPLFTILTRRNSTGVWTYESQAQATQFFSYNGSTPQSYIQAWTTVSSFNATFQKPSVNGNSDTTAPASWQFAYIVYKVGNNT